MDVADLASTHPPTIGAARIYSANSGKITGLFEEESPVIFVMEYFYVNPFLINIFLVEENKRQFFEQ